MDKRIHKINRLLTDYSLGKFERRLDLSEKLDDIDAFITGVNMLGEELKDSTIRKNYVINILNSVSDIVLVLNRAGRIEEINKTACEQLECPREELLGRTLDEWQEGGRGSLFSFIFHQLKAGKPSVFSDSVFITATGKKIPVNIYSSYLMDDTRKNSSIIVTAKDITLQIQSENLLLRAIIDTQEKERQRLAQDLHDSLGQQISAIKFYISAAVDNTADSRNRDILLKSNEALMKVQAEMRNICFNLMPKTLEEFGLLKAIEQLCKQPTYAGRVRFTIDCPEDFPSLLQKVEIDIFRVVQEFITNALRHGNADKIWMKFQHNKTQVRIVLKDNGQGFELAEGLASPGRGLYNVQSRIKSHEGEVRIKSSPGSGAEYHLTLPNKH
ncbi:PAS domain-containing sensor histidine kinase [Dinghuibacter silviterrae]|uniref:PAS domain-containing sensor histidine kinase n=1 Tax=Dinghuibacter silviterrae TaxID=1539049 RepID=UPI0013C368D1|nr:ATP-binding protein [Dinghuibacter silviterrae]